MPSIRHVVVLMLERRPFDDGLVTLPALTTLAREFAVCDRWYASVPGPTWPNRFVAHASSAGGEVGHTGPEYPMRTIFDHLAAAGEDWAVYFHDVPQCLALTSLRKPEYKRHFRTFGVSFAMACRTGALPSYSFVEPRYFDFLGLKANDQHPPHDVALGEHLIADVYDNLRSSPAWPHTLLLVTYAGSGGLDDPARVPAIVVSPFIAKGTVDSTVYDHASIPATLKAIFGLPAFLTQRDEAANTFTRTLTNALRADTPLSLPRPGRPPAPPGAITTASAMEDEDLVRAAVEAQASHAPLTAFQDGLLAATRRLELPETPRERIARLAALPRDEHDGAVIVRATVERYLKGEATPPAAVDGAPALVGLAAPEPYPFADVRACVDRTATPPDGRERLALVKDRTWAPGQVLSVRFLSGDATLRERVKTHAKEWMRHANIRLIFNDAANAPIRIAFKPGGSWSLIGRDCLNEPLARPTMNFGWLRPDSPDDEISRVVLHEFGHALGCVHEHNHPEGGIAWKKQAVYDYYLGPPNFWSKDKVDRNLFALYDRTLTVFSAVDPQSIMMYPVDSRFTEDGFSVGMNRTLSANDIAFIKKVYPF
jgi:serralysin